MATLMVMLAEDDRELQPPPTMPHFHFIQVRLSGLLLDDKEIIDYCQVLGMTLLTAVRDANSEVVMNDAVKTSQGTKQ